MAAGTELASGRGGTPNRYELRDVVRARRDKPKIRRTTGSNNGLSIRPIEPGTERAIGSDD
jgi:hypothetical protein